jgi:hypothetical protein
VVAPNFDVAIERLDEIDDANDPQCQITTLNDFLVTFKLADDGEFVCEGLGEVAHDEIMKAAYPALLRRGSEAVKQERERLSDGGGEEE